MFDSFYPDRSFASMSVIGSVIFAAVICLFVLAIVKAIKEKRRNDASPRLTVDAFVVSKREDVSSMNQPLAGDATGARGFHTMTTTRYFVTFEVRSGDRMELEVEGDDYGMLAEGDAGRLTFQGTRYLGFEREV